jgi:hypothetical protein
MLSHEVVSRLGGLGREEGQHSGYGASRAHDADQAAAKRAQDHQGGTVTAALYKQQGASALQGLPAGSLQEAG